MPASKMARLLVLILCSMLLLGACTRDNNGDDGDEVETTDAPSPTPSVEAVSDFALVGRIDEAFAGQLPPVDLPDEELDLETDSTASPGASPAATPVGTTPTRGGIIRLAIEDLSEDLRETCGFEATNIVELYWTTNTFFEPAEVLDDVEDEIEDRVAAISGRIFRTDGDTDVIDEESPEATLLGTGSPAATGSPSASVEASDCLLVAEQVGFTTTSLPTARPAVRRTAAPAVRTATPTPARTASPSPRATSSPDETDDASPSAAPTST